MTIEDRCTIISADCHAGGNHTMYREHLTAELQAEFDEWGNGDLYADGVVAISPAFQRD